RKWKRGQELRDGAGWCCSCGWSAVWEGEYRRADGSSALKDGSVALAHPDAHGAKCIPFARAVQFQRGGLKQPGTGHAQRVAQCDGPAVRVDAGIIVLQAPRTRA